MVVKLNQYIPEMKKDIHSSYPFFWLVGVFSKFESYLCPIKLLRCCFRSHIMILACHNVTCLNIQKGFFAFKNVYEPVQENMLLVINKLDSCWAFWLFPNSQWRILFFMWSFVCMHPIKDKHIINIDCVSIYFKKTCLIKMYYMLLIFLKS